MAQCRLIRPGPTWQPSRRASASEARNAASASCPSARRDNPLLGKRPLSIECLPEPIFFELPRTASQARALSQVGASQLRQRRTSADGTVGFDDANDVTGTSEGDFRVSCLVRDHLADQEPDTHQSEGWCAIE